VRQRRGPAERRRLAVVGGLGAVGLAAGAALAAASWWGRRRRAVEAETEAARR